MPEKGTRKNGQVYSSLFAIKKLSPPYLAAVIIPSG